VHAVSSSAAAKGSRRQGARSGRRRRAWGAGIPGKGGAQRGPRGALGAPSASVATRRRQFENPAGCRPSPPSARGPPEAPQLRAPQPPPAGTHPTLLGHIMASASSCRYAHPPPSLPDQGLCLLSSERLSLLLQVSSTVCTSFTPVCALQEAHAVVCVPTQTCFLESLLKDGRPSLLTDGRPSQGGRGRQLLAVPPRTPRSP